VLAEKSEAPDGRGAMLNAAIAALKEDRKIRYRRSVRQQKNKKAYLTLRWARDSSACMKAPSEEIYGKSTQRT